MTTICNRATTFQLHVVCVYPRKGSDRGHPQSTIKYRQFIDSCMQLLQRDAIVGQLDTGKSESRKPLPS